ncbi:unnamed protein product [Lymnaea stagnalis]|uniref:Beta-1,4-glucuronyltransferase 1 n=1 Tax=Lymnaea stagnalis TaxID=6523 RepID=A0AAV2HCR6_LYMST
MFKKATPLWRMSTFYRCRFWPCLTSLVLAIVLLQVLHMALLSRLEEKEARLKDTKSVGRQLQGRVYKTVVGEMEERVRNSYRFDKSGTYHVLDNFLTSEHVIPGRHEYDVSIVTQCSTGNLHHLVDLSQRWNGPVSVAVFTYDDDFIQTVASLLHFHFCNDAIYRHVSFHLVYPISRAPKHLEGLSRLKLACSSDAGTTDFPLPHGKSPNYVNTDLAYPNNLLRNLAINYAQTPYILMIDIDMVPSENLRTQFQNFMSLNHPSIPPNRLSANISGKQQHSSGPVQPLAAYVVPAFELQDSTPVPRTKTELLDLWLKGRVRPFYWEACQKCQRPTNYDRWRALGKGGALRIGYSVSREDPWEPFYIARTSVPLYDERFKQYGYNRISQICEMFVAGFSFHVLDNAFLVHKGFKVQGEFHTSKDAENDQNRLLYRKFKDELKVKYPEVTRRC